MLFFAALRRLGNDRSYLRLGTPLFPTHARSVWERSFPNQPDVTLEPVGKGTSNTRSSFMKTRPVPGPSLCLRGRPPFRAAPAQGYLSAASIIPARTGLRSAERKAAQRCSVSSGQEWKLGDCAAEPGRATGRRSQVAREKIRRGQLSAQPREEAGAGVKVRHCDYGQSRFSTAPPGAFVTILTKRQQGREIHYFYAADTEFD